MTNERKEKTGLEQRHSLVTLASISTARDILASVVVVVVDVVGSGWVR
jgi:hypothetical protein